MRPERKLGAACQAGSVLWEYIVMVLVALVTWKKKKKSSHKNPHSGKERKKKHRALASGRTGIRRTLSSQLKTHIHIP
jgi:hypothetical protein